jgi:nitrate reductase alpha subunit
LGDTTWKDLKDKGFARYTGVSMGPVYIGNATDIEPDQTLVANTWHVQKKIPWPTLTRRLQFYIDHPFYEELGEVLPVHKDNPPIGGNYPLQLTSGHNRWSIHAAWRDQDLLLRLQRGEPSLFLSPSDAGSRGIADGARVRVYNDIGEFEVQATVAPSVKPGQVIIYHAWEPFQFKNGTCDQVLTPSPFNPIRLAGGYFNLQPMVMMGTPEGNDRGTRVEVEKVRGGEAAPEKVEHQAAAG